MLNRVVKSLGIILLSLYLSGCGLLWKERIVYQCPVLESHLTLSKAPPPDFSSNEGVIESYTQMGQALGQCNADKVEIKRQIDDLSREK